ncbi:hypothetical protein J7W19_18380 [Streptomyces mobaraensis NBRC 13819 = DSM 40847]|uniref:Uncharacterized protein n=1 Tax=Streptomyces mobaraensis TaxID=35621 RepID=A0A5N5W0S2_STRMB|nr:hypothetical protein [Streptomyces mobaraensis]KAB7834140.1 hypothetical protein FRZ00_31300 [Streptomyces mobaraensis]QTT78265.1 hypothetical protein J7W19_18380 [Streptomyces mobaraensis NBRC 13819 = DSM 40847]
MSETHPAQRSARPSIPSPAAPEHHVSTSERGAFCSARCTCGWLGPARRARSQARTDADGHLAQTGH